jgi:hypothetical protein
MKCSVWIGNERLFAPALQHKDELREILCGTPVVEGKNEEKHRTAFSDHRKTDFHQTVIS